MIAPLETSEELRRVVAATLDAHWFVSYPDVLEAWRVHQGAPLTEAEAALVEAAYHRELRDRPLAAGAEEALAASWEWQRLGEAQACERRQQPRAAAAGGRLWRGAAMLGGLVGVLLAGFLVLSVAAVLLALVLLLLVLVALGALVSRGPRRRAWKLT
jgi:VIT1/CCC1 family predicted Fe2+/Mn2+ transporter